MENGTLISTEGLVKRFPIGGSQFTALKDVNLKIERGEFTGLVGPSGSGKTTLLNILGALDNPSEGHAVVIGQDTKKLSHKQAAHLRSEHLGFIFQTYNLLPVYTVFENVEFPLLLLNMSAEKRKQAVMQALEWVGLEDKVNSRPAQLSGGESQRVAIARAIVNDPGLIVADEPTGDLDRESATAILNLLRELSSEYDNTIVMVTHDPVAANAAMRTLHLEKGRLVEPEVRIPQPLEA